MDFTPVNVGMKDFTPVNVGLKKAWQLRGSNKVPSKS